VSAPETPRNVERQEPLDNRRVGGSPNFPLVYHEWTAVGGVPAGMVSAGFFLNSAKPWTKT
jgi:hypothetical protein